MSYPVAAGFSLFGMLEKIFRFVILIRKPNDYYVYMGLIFGFVVPNETAMGKVNANPLLK